MASGPNMEDNELGFTITQDEFISSAKIFADKSKKLYDGWQIAEQNGVKFLRLEKQMILENNMEHSVREQTKVMREYKPPLNLEPCTNNESSGSCEASNLISLEYHVIYSISYCVPGLYIRGFDSLGGVLRVDKLIKKGIFPNGYEGNNDFDANDLGFVTELNDTSNIPQCSLTDNNFVRPDTFSQAPHPLLFEPFYQLHPCHTSQWMKMMYSVKSAEKHSKSQTQLSVDNYIIIWLSFVGPYVGLSLDNKYMLI